MNQPGLLRAIEDEPHAFNFFQAVLALEQVFPERDLVGGYGSPANETVRFETRPTLAFPPSDIQAFSLRESGQPQLTVNFMSAAGVLGPLPNVYTNLILERERSRDRTLRSFLDLFHHRLVSLFYLAWRKYHFALAYRKHEQDQFTGYLLDIAGLGSPGLQNRQAVHDHALVYYAGLLGPEPRSAAALEQLLSDHFGVDVKVEQFVGGWYDLERHALCWMDGEDAPSRRLGEGAIAGDAIFDQQARLRLRIGPLTLPMFKRFLPGGGAWEQLSSLALFYGQGQFDFEAQLVLSRQQAPEYELGSEEERALPLGLCSWLSPEALDHDPDDAVLQLAE
jgi:type VI secretion system protein ImpH